MPLSGSLSGLGSLSGFLMKLSPAARRLPWLAGSSIQARPEEVRVHSGLRSIISRPSRIPLQGLIKSSIAHVRRPREVEVVHTGFLGLLYVN